ncbi:hypothetical protein HDR60_04790 [bacterium]|nr:hypothetical protein [bacterium]
MDIFKNTKITLLIAITCTIICVVGKYYKNFDFIEFNSFKLSFDFVYFISLVIAIISILILISQFLSLICQKIRNQILFFKLKNCNNLEKDFFNYKTFLNNNEQKIDMNFDSYFYRNEELFGINNGKELYRYEFDTKEKVGKFLRELENKGLINNFGNQTMIIPDYVWKILVKKYNKIFDGFSPILIRPTERKLKFCKVLYNTISCKHKKILKEIVNAPSSGYENVKIIDSNLLEDASDLKYYDLLQEMELTDTATVSMITFNKELYNILKTIINEDENK